MKQHPLETVANSLGLLTEWIGKTLAWLSITMMLAMTAVVVLRYGLNIGSVFLQESVMYMHAALFLLACGYTLKHDGHVRVDIFYRNFSAKKKALVNLLGTLTLLMPVMLFIAWSSWGYVEKSWAIKEISSEPGGIPAVYLLKSLIPAMVVVMLLQALAELINNSLILLGLKLVDEQNEEPIA